MPPRWTKAWVVGFRVLVGLGVPHEGSMSVMTMSVMVMVVGMCMRVHMAKRADPSVFLELLHSPSVERPGISPSGLETCVWQQLDDGLKILLCSLG